MQSEASGVIIGEKAELSGLKSLKGNAQILGGQHHYLDVGDDTVIAGNSWSYRLKMRGNATVKGAVRLQKVSLDGDVLIDVPNGLEPPMALSAVIDTEAGDCESLRYAFYDITPHPEYSDTVRDSSFVSPSSGILRTAVATYGFIKHPAWRDSTMCLKASTHLQANPHCHCLLWYPLILTGNPVALHYLFRVEGLIQSGIRNSDYPALDGTAHNPLSTLSWAMLENALAGKVRSLIESPYNELASRNRELHPWGVYHAEYRREGEPLKWVNNIILEFTQHIQPVYISSSEVFHMVKEDFKPEDHLTWEKYIRQLPESWLAHYRKLTGQDPAP